MALCEGKMCKNKVNFPLQKPHTKVNIILIALSGGSDSVALLHYMMTVNNGKPSDQRAQLIATHCNFHLRGYESMRDQEFCQQLCTRLDIELLVKDFDTRSYMAEKKLSLELAARKLRYQWWDELATQFEADGHTVQIAVGHHRDDSIETFLFNLMRGTGIKGLTGIPSRNGRIIRPLNEWTRQQILEYLSQNNLSYVTDSSNLENDAMRNKIRNRLLPLMEEINPNARKGIALTMQHLRQAEYFANKGYEEFFSSTQLCEADNVSWFEFPIKALEQISGGEQCQSSIFNTDSMFHIWAEIYGADDPQNTVRRNSNLFYTEPPAEIIAAQQNSISYKIFDKPFDLLTEEETCHMDLGTEFFDADKVQLPLTIRHWQNGDRIQPLGMSHTKLVSDLFTNAHYSPVRKATTWIVADASGQILWVVGLHIADWCKLTPQTRRVLRLTQPALVRKDSRRLLREIKHRF